MIDRLRVPFFVVAFAAALLVVLLETSASLLIGGRDATTGLLTAAGELEMAVTGGGGGGVSEPPGRAISYLALVDGVLLFTLLLMGAGLLLPHRLHGRLQGVVTLVFAILLILAALGLLLLAIVEVITMVVLFFAFPFGTLAYLVIWGSFPRGDAATLLSLLMFLKLVAGAALLLAHQRFIQNKGLVLMVLTALIGNLVVAFLHGLVPGILVSITDDIAAIVLAIVAIVWAIILLIGSIPAVVKAVRVTASR